MPTWITNDIAAIKIRANIMRRRTKKWEHIDKFNTHHLGDKKEKAKYIVNIVKNSIISMKLPSKLFEKWTI